MGILLGAWECKFLFVVELMAVGYRLEASRKGAVGSSC